MIDDPDAFDLSGLLRRARRTADLSQRELAERAGVSASSVARAELGELGLSLRTVLQLFAAAGMHLTVVDEEDQTVEPMRPDGIRDRRGQRYAAHLDPEPMVRDGRDHLPIWRWQRPDPVAAQEHRDNRDDRRARAGTPLDHPGPESLRPRPRPLRSIRPTWLSDVPDCTCPLECERACVPHCPCQCEPPAETWFGPFAS